VLPDSTKSHHDPWPCPTVLRCCLATVSTFTAQRLHLLGEEPQHGGRVCRNVDNDGQYVLIIIPTRCTNLSSFGIKFYMFRAVPLSIISSFSLYTQQWYVSYRFADSLRAGSGCSIPLACCQQTCMTYHCCVYSKKTPDDGQRNCPKHVEFYSKNKFEKLLHLRGKVEHTERPEVRTTPNVD
jgi:hypothetical protein